MRATRCHRAYNMSDSVEIKSWRGSASYGCAAIIKPLIAETTE